MPIEPNDTFPLWTFVYAHPPVADQPHKQVTARGRNHHEAWICIQHINQSFLEPEKVGLANRVSFAAHKDYSRTHPYDWLHDAPLWLKMQEGAHELIW